jgi:hypothetical protein
MRPGFSGSTRVGTPMREKRCPEQGSLFGGGLGGHDQGGIGKSHEKREQGEGPPLVQPHGRPVYRDLFRSGGDRVGGVDGAAQQEPLEPPAEPLESFFVRGRGQSVTSKSFGSS